MLIDDAKDFLGSKTWYADRGTCFLTAPFHFKRNHLHRTAGIPFRRGYLLYGAPGSGKTSMIHSLAGELGLDVYVISLSRAGLDDSGLAELIGDMPERCIALMEDIDAAFASAGGLERRDLSSTGPNPAAGSEQQAQAQNQPPPPPSSTGPRSTASRITLSGLLNAIDGIGAHDGRLLYATTNKYEALDQALCRPGRMDLHVEFRLASRWQAGEMFRCFYLPGGNTDDEGDNESADDSGYSSPGSGTPVTTVLDLLPETDEKLVLPPSSTLPKSDAPMFGGNSHRNRAPALTRRQINTLATAFEACIPEREFSMAALQGYLMSYKIRPVEAAREVEKWIEKQRAEKAERLRNQAQVPTVATVVPAKIPDAKVGETVPAVTAA